MKDLIILHLYDANSWKTYAKLLDKIDQKFDLYVTSTMILDHSLIAKDFPSVCIIDRSFKHDVESFLFVLDHVIRDGEDYNIITKIHDYNLYHMQDNQRERCFDDSKLSTVKFVGNETLRYVEALIGSADRYNEVSKALNTKANNIAMCCCFDQLVNDTKDPYIWVSQHIDDFNIHIDGLENRQFPMHRIFSVDYHLYKTEFSKVELAKYYNYKDNRDKYIKLHVMERVFGLLVSKNNKCILLIKPFINENYTV